MPAGATPARETRNPRASRAALTSSASSGGWTNSGRTGFDHLVSDSASRATTAARSVADGEITGPEGR